jgi:hypothetical protein
MSLGTTFKKIRETITLRVDFDNALFPGLIGEAKIIDHEIRIVNLINNDTTTFMLRDSIVPENKPLRVEMQIREGHISMSPYTVNVSAEIDFGDGTQDVLRDSFDLIVIADDDNVRDVMSREALNRTRGLRRGDPPFHPNCRSEDLGQGRPLSEVLDFDDDEGPDLSEAIDQLEAELAHVIPDNAARKRKVRVIRIDKNRRTRT